MIDRILTSISFIFHPLIMPILGVVFYFAKSPRYIPPEIIKAKLVSLFILTIILPILLYFLLKTLRKVKSIYLESARERIFPLTLNFGVILIVLQRILTPTRVIELYYFFVGILISTLACLIGAGLLLFTGIASWRIIFSTFIGGIAMALIFNAVAPADNGL